VDGEEVGLEVDGLNVGDFVGFEDDGVPVGLEVDGLNVGDFVGFEDEGE
jgi:hypothetical protein